MLKAMEQLSVDRDICLEGQNFEVRLVDEPDQTTKSPNAANYVLNHWEKNLAPVRIVKRGDLRQEMALEIKAASELFSLRPTCVRILMNFFLWDKEKILEQTANGESLTKLRDIGIIISPGQPAKCPQKPQASNLQHCRETCLSCRCVKNVSVMVFTGCGHWFCKRCFLRYLKQEILEIGDRSNFQCPYILCSMFLEDDIVLRNLPEDLQKPFTQLCVKDFLYLNKYRKACPTEECKRTCYVDVSLSTKFQEVCCDCGINYCFECTNMWHYPLTCDQLKKWLELFQKIPDYSTLANFKSDKKPCPRCLIMNMNPKKLAVLTCLTCNERYCWKCLDKAMCTKCLVEPNQHDNQPQLLTQPEMMALVKIHDDYDVLCDQFSMFAGNDSSTRKQGIVKLNEPEGSPIDMVRDSVKYSQKLLQNSYGFAYFLKNTCYKLHFMKQLFRLEIALSKQLDVFDVDEYKFKIYREIHGEKEKLYQLLLEGFEKDLWSFRKTKSAPYKIIKPRRFSPTSGSS